jgi:hypothetical protein
VSTPPYSENVFELDCEIVGITSECHCPDYFIIFKNGNLTPRAKTLVFNAGGVAVAWFMHVSLH